MDIPLNVMPLPRDKTILIGYNRRCGRYCILSTFFSWEWLNENPAYVKGVLLELHQSDYSGLDSSEHVTKVLKENGLTAGFEEMVLPEPYEFSVSEDEKLMHREWKFEISSIINTLRL